MSNSTNIKMIKCPGCADELPENDLRAQMQHMEKNHPEIINQRLKGTDCKTVTPSNN